LLPSYSGILIGSEWSFRRDHVVNRKRMRKKLRSLEGQEKMLWETKDHVSDIH
jgi:hypothetical protein